MNKTDLILKYFQKADQLTVTNKEYQHTLSSLFNWLITNDKVVDDKTSKYFPDISREAKIIAKERGTLAGSEEVEFLLRKYTNLSAKPLLKDGSKFNNGDTIAQIKGKAHEVLAYERTILNILQRMSGIATETNKLINIMAGDAREGLPNSASQNGERSDLKRNFGIPERQDPQIPFIASTRKTPWMGLDKKAVAVGGGLTHRLNLSDGILIKDNHLKLIQSLEEFCQRLQQNSLSRQNPHIKGLIEVEVTNEKQARQVIQAFSKQSTIYDLAILLDNFSPQLVKQVLNNLKKEFDLSSVIFEASGGINEGNIREWAETSVDILSLGALTHSAKSINFSLEF